MTSLSNYLICQITQKVSILKLQEELHGYTALNSTRTKLLEKMYKAGFTWLSVGVEMKSFSYIPLL